MTRTRVPEAYRSTAKAARKAGWRITLTSRHLRWRSPDGTVIITAATPSGTRSFANDLANLRRAGLKGSRT